MMMIVSVIKRVHLETGNEGAQWGTEINMTKHNRARKAIV
jgi:hypothetical protein